MSKNRHSDILISTSILCTPNVFILPPCVWHGPVSVPAQNIKSAIQANEIVENYP